MAYMRIAAYHLRQGNAVDEVLRRVETGLLPIFQQQPGFVAYEIVTIADGLLSISTWQSKEQADAATQSASAWVREHLTPFVNLAENYVGEVALSRRSG